MVVDYPNSLAPVVVVLVEYYPSSLVPVVEVLVDRKHFGLVVELVRTDSEAVGVVLAVHRKRLVAQVELVDRRYYQRIRLVGVVEAQLAGLVYQIQ